VTTLILVRHAQSAPDPALPNRDWPLSELGRQQAADLAPVLKALGVDVLASSPFVRAVETLRPYADAAGLSIEVDEDLRERALGGWLATTEEAEEAIRRMHADLDFALEGGETGRACLARFEAALARVVAANPGRTIAAAAHGGVIGHLLASQAPLEGEFWRRIRNPHIFVFDARGPLKWVSERAFDGTPGVQGG
jgi:2,3-bisphosphoglycerate-dependent phosphoglycerate mutase